MFGVPGRLAARKPGDETNDLRAWSGAGAGYVDGDVGSIRLKGSGAGARHIANVHEMLDFRAIAHHARRRSASGARGRAS